MRNQPQYSNNNSSTNSISIIKEILKEFIPFFDVIDCLKNEIFSIKNFIKDTKIDFCEFSTKLKKNNIINVDENNTLILVKILDVIDMILNTSTNYIENLVGVTKFNYSSNTAKKVYENKDFLLKTYMSSSQSDKLSKDTIINEKLNLKKANQINNSNNYNNSEQNKIKNNNDYLPNDKTLDNDSINVDENNKIINLLINNELFNNHYKYNSLNQHSNKKGFIFCDKINISKLSFELIKGILILIKTDIIRILETKQFNYEDINLIIIPKLNSIKTIIFSEIKLFDYKLLHLLLNFILMFFSTNVEEIIFEGMLYNKIEQVDVMIKNGVLLWFLTFTKFQKLSINNKIEFINENIHSKIFYEYLYNMNKVNKKSKLKTYLSKSIEKNSFIDPKIKIDNENILNENIIKGKIRTSKIKVSSLSKNNSSKKYNSISNSKLNLRNKKNQYIDENVNSNFSKKEIECNNINNNKIKKIEKFKDLNTVYYNSQNNNGFKLKNLNSKLSKKGFLSNTDDKNIHLIQSGNEYINNLNVLNYEGSELEHINMLNTSEYYSENKSSKLNSDKDNIRLKMSNDVIKIKSKTNLYLKNLKSKNKLHTYQSDENQDINADNSKKDKISATESNTETDSEYRSKISNSNSNNNKLKNLENVSIGNINVFNILEIKKHCKLISIDGVTQDNSNALESTISFLINNTDLEVVNLDRFTVIPEYFKNKLFDSLQNLENLKILKISILSVDKNDISRILTIICHSNLIKISINFPRLSISLEELNEINNKIDIFNNSNKKSILKMEKCSFLCERFFIMEELNIDESIEILNFSFEHLNLEKSLLEIQRMKPIHINFISDFILNKQSISELSLGLIDLKIFLNLISLINIRKSHITFLKISFSELNKYDSKIVYNVLIKLIESNLYISNLDIRNLIIKYDCNEEEKIKKLIKMNRTLKSLNIEIHQPFITTMIYGIHYWEYPINLSIFLLCVFRKKVEFRKFDKFLLKNILNFFRYKKEKLVKISYRN